MIPLGDSSRRPNHFPGITVIIILVNIFVFLLELMGGESFVMRWAVIPADLSSGQHWITILSAMFMHGSWLHILGNMIFLWAFGPEIEDIMNPWRYSLFYLLGGLAAILAQIAANYHSKIPNLGASGAIAAVMGAFLVTYPRDRIRTILVIGIFVRVTFIPASILIGVWFIAQLFSLGTLANVQTGGVAYLAHIGGMIFGAVMARFFEDPQRLVERRWIDY